VYLKIYHLIERLERRFPCLFQNAVFYFFSNIVYKGYFQKKFYFTNRTPQGVLQSFFTPEFTIDQDSEFFSEFLLELKRVVFEKFNVRLNDFDVFYLSHLFSLEQFKASAVENSLDEASLVMSFLTDGLSNNVSFSFLFDEKVFFDQVPNEKKSQVPAVLSWLKKYRYKKNIPNLFFSEKMYLDSNPGLQPLRLFSLFDHYVLYGFREKRLFTNFTLQSDFSLKLDDSVNLSGWLKAWGCDSLDEELASDSLREQISLAVKIEPALLKVNNTKYLRMYPYSDGKICQSSLVKTLKHNHYEAIVFIPELRTGGAERIACILATTLKKILSSKRVLLCVTDGACLDRVDWVPGVDILPLSKVSEGGDFSNTEKEEVLLNLIVGLRVKHVINVNSLALWNLYGKKAKLLSQFTSLYVYLFCWDYRENKKGAKVLGGYAANCLSEVLPYLTRVFVDNKSFSSELVQTYFYSNNDAQKFFPLYTPIEESTQLEEMKTATGEKILWSGRICLQKRFDLLIAIAKKMPDRCFDVWGALTIKGSFYEKEKIPSNVYFKGVYKSPSEVDVKEYGAFLYTSEWDGLPTVLLDFISQKIPVVASGVGDISTLINKDSGFLIQDINNVESYVSALNDVLASKSLAKALSTQACLNMKKQHSYELYNQKVRSVFQGEN